MKLKIETTEEIVKKLYNDVYGLNWPMGMDYGCALALFEAGPEKDMFEKNIINAFKQVFVNDPDRLELELSDLEEYSKK